jgi:hypothetical protein
MFSRKSCYFFVRPKRDHLELCVFLGRAVKAPQVHRVDRSSKTKLAHIIRVRHRDEVEAPITDWILEAYRLPDVLAAQQSPAGPRPASTPARARPAGRAPARKRKRTPSRKSPRSRPTRAARSRRR